MELTAKTLLSNGEILRLKDVWFSWKDHSIIKGINLSVRRGEFLGIIGPNGAGKTTLLRLIAGLIKPSQGSIHLDGRPLGRMTRREVAREIAMVPQKPATEFAFSVQDVVNMGRYPHRGRFEMQSKQDLAIVQDAMRLTETSQLADRPITEISGGEQQRVILARALAQDPKILLLDEPTSNLDPLYQLQVLKVVRGRVEKGIAVVSPMHDLELASRFCDRLILLKGGTILAEGSPEQVLVPEHLRTGFRVKAKVFPDRDTGGLKVTILDAVTD
jgi:iron complex transport system ATP-binding protein